MDIKHVQVRLSQAEYELVNEASRKSGKKLQELAREALLSAANPTREAQAVSGTEQRILDGILAFLRSSTAEPAIVNLIKHYAAVGEEQVREEKKKNKAG